LVDDGEDLDGDGSGVCDCDDQNPDAYPGKWDRDGDGVDSNCDGEDWFDLGYSTSAVVGPNNGGVGRVVAAVGDVNDDGHADVAFQDLTADTYVHLVFGRAGNWEETVDVDVSMAGETVQDEAGASISAAGDVNGDGVNDLLVGAPGFQQSNGKAYVLFGRDAYWPTQLAIADVTFLSEENDSRAGTAVAGAGDLNGDGFADILVGASEHTGGEGRAYLVFGRDTGWPWSLADADVKILAHQTLEGTGASLDGDCDFNADGIADAVVAAVPDYGTAAFGILFGKQTGWTDLVLGDADVFVSTNVRSNVACAGDLNGDGWDDLLAGSPGSYGRVYLVFGRDQYWPENNDGADVTIMDTEYGAQFGTIASSAGDVDGDGLNDILMSAPDASPTVGLLEAGKVYVALGRQGGWITSPAGANYLFAGENAQDSAGSSIDIAGDMNADGFDDLVVGAPGAGFNGVVYLVLSST